MLKILGRTNKNFCDGVSRRQFIHVGALGVGGITLPKLLRADAKTSSQQSVVMIYLCGGPTQHETFDPKPTAPTEIRGSYGTTATQTAGARFCELIPKLSAISNKYSVVRTLVGMQNRHESFQCYTGRPGGRAGDAEPAGGWPTFGSAASMVLGPGRDGMVPYVDASPETPYGPYRNRGLHDASGKISWPGFTGRAHVPFALQGNVKADLKLNGIDAARLHDRKALLKSIAANQRAIEVDGLDAFQRQAFGLLTSSRLAEALDLSREPQKTVEKYGKAQATDPSFGGAPQSPQHLLLARRLIEAGVRCVTVAFGAWDWHANREGTIEYLSKKYLPVFDHALSVFITDLEERGLLDSTTVVVWGEFGRTPRINAKGGRDHWPGTQSVLLAGGGIQGGRIVGATDRAGGVPNQRPVHVQEVFATLYQQLGINTDVVKIPDLNGRPRYLVDDNSQRIKELFD